MALFIKKNGSLQQVAIGHEISKEEQVKVVALDMAQGDQNVLPSENKVLSQVTITKPDTLVAGNIKQGVNIGGVVGTYEAQDYLNMRLNQNVTEYTYENNDIIVANQNLGSDSKITSFKSTSLQTLASSMFYRCSNLVTIIIPNVQNPSNSNISAPFMQCSKLKNLDLGNFNGKIWPNFVYECYDLENVNLQYATRIDSNGSNFRSCSKLTQIYLPANTSGIPSNFANGCSALTTANLGSPTAISSQAFYYCIALTDLTILTTSVCTLSNVNAFSNIGHQVTIHVPSNLISSYQTASNWTTLYNNNVVTFVAIQ